MLTTGQADGNRERTLLRFQLFSTSAPRLPPTTRTAAPFPATAILSGHFQHRLPSPAALPAGCQAACGHPDTPAQSRCRLRAQHQQAIPIPHFGTSACPALSRATQRSRGIVSFGSRDVGAGPTSKPFCFAGHFQGERRPRPVATPPLTRLRPLLTLIVHRPARRPRPGVAEHHGWPRSRVRSPSDWTKAGPGKSSRWATGTP